MAVIVAFRVVPTGKMPPSQGFDELDRDCRPASRRVAVEAPFDAGNSQETSEVDHFISEFHGKYGRSPANNDNQYDHAYDSDESSNFGCVESDFETFTHSIMIDGRQEDITIAMWFSTDEDSGHPEWFENLLVNVKSASGEDIGRAKAHHVMRDDIRRFFRQHMESASEGLAELASSVFDRFGNLKDEFMTHPIRKGSGAFGNEVSRGSFLCIETLEISVQKYKRLGIGALVTRKILQKCTAGCSNVSFAFVWPSQISTDVFSRVSSDEWLRARGEVVSFWRSVGFRRIGPTCWFGYPLDSNHQVRKLAAGDDYDPPTVIDDLGDECGETLEMEPDLPEAGISSFFEQKANRRKAREQRKYPLHFASRTLPDAELVRCFAEASSDTDWKKQDAHWDTVLHVVAKRVLSKSIRWLLLCHPDQMQELLFHRNALGYTPIEALEAKYYKGRGRSLYEDVRLVPTDMFKGYTDLAVESLALLKFGLEGPTMLQSNEGLRLRLKFGCTCGTCCAGLLSPRTRHTLIVEAEIISETLGGWARREYKDEKEFEEALECVEHFFKDVPTHIRKLFQKDESLRRGFVGIIDVIRGSIHDNGGLPILEAFIHANPSANSIASFLRAGGTIASCVKSILRFARDRDWLCGNGYLMEFMPGFKSDMDGLPRCRNDSEYGAFARMYEVVVES
ncbi:hypothetical protein BJ508DRAFT_322990 [Ascobolus immersus RN42]|uniref:Uncharacterized protein n=1 Tax=Ascobolus immersus RN42 TaxID=1160509 RepID=A0A3N4ILU0_ASCIM|nr:hypothetical protein BJ508DRAFT_322990 [Ascobolus immersus RN42]